MRDKKVALVTGATGQDASYLFELLLSKGYECHGIKRRSSFFNTQRIEHIFDKVTLHHGDMTDGMSLMRILSEVKPDEVYHLAAQSHVQVSFELPEYTANSDALGTLRMLEAIRMLGLKCRFYNAGTSEMFGDAPPPQNEKTPFSPQSPYAVAKLYAHFITTCYRKSYGLYACNGILFNHESPRRGETFVTRKITRSLGKREKEIRLGNLEAKRDWGHARDHVEAMWLMLQQPEPDDYVIATGQSYSVREFLETASRIAGHTPAVVFDKRYLRPAEVPYLLGDASKARRVLGWAPKVGFEELVTEMVRADEKN